MLHFAAALGGGATQNGDGCRRQQVTHPGPRECLVPFVDVQLSYRLVITGTAEDGERFAKAYPRAEVER